MNMLKKFLLTFSFVISFVSFSFAYSGGTGSESSPYVISSESDLLEFRNRVNNASDDSGSYYVISTDASGFQMTKYRTWTPIGTGNSFTGHFDGNNKIVYVNIDNTSGAFFGTIGSGATVTNLNIEGSVRTTSDAGGLALTLNGGTIEACRFSGNIYVHDDDGNVAENLNAAGLVVTMNSGEIRDSTFNGEITINGGIYPRAGGIVSLMHGGNIYDCSITHYSSIESYASEEYADEPPSAIAGGIVGQVNLDFGEMIRGCEFRGKVTAESNNTSYAGGIVGYMRGGTLRDNTVLDDSVIKGAYTAGGIVGFLRTGGTVDSNIVQAGSVVTAESNSAGGIIGILDLGTVTNNESHASITGNASCKGGIIGRVTPATETPATRIISGNKYSGADHGIGSDSSGLPSNDGTEHVDLPFTITTSSTLTSGKIYEAYSQEFTTNISSDSAVWLKIDGDFPSGLTLSGNTLSGTPTETGTFEFTLRASVYSSYKSAEKTFSLTINSQLNIITSSNLADGTTGKTYGPLTLKTDAEDGAYVTWTASGLPSGLSLGRLTGILSGTPSEAGYFKFTVTASSGSYTATKEFTITIIPSLNITTDSVLPSGVRGVYYSVTLECDASDSDSVTWTRTNGSLPSGLTLSSSGVISGTPSSSGTFSFTVRASLDGTDYTDSKEFYITIASSFSIITTSADLGYARMSQYYSYNLETNAEDSDNVLWSITGGSLPDGITLASYSGRIYGTPTTAGYYTFTVRAISGGLTAEKELGLMVRPALSIITSSDLPDGIINKPYSQDIETDAEAGNPIEWSFVSGKLPDGISFDVSSGMLYGTPTKTGTFTFTIGAKTGNYKAENVKFTLRILRELTITTESPLADAKVSHTYNVNISAASIAGEAYSWSVTSGTLPDGLELNESNTSTVSISGTPTTEGTYTFTLQVIAAGMIASREFSLTVNPLLMITTDSVLPNAKMNQPYSCTLETDNESDNFVMWSVSGGSLPQGLVIGSYTGVISGSPTESGYFTFTIRASAGSVSSEKEFGITVAPSLTITTSADLPEGIINTRYSHAFETDAEEGNIVTWSSSGTLPPGLSLDSSTGILSGTPTRTGDYTFTLKATTGGITASKEFNLTIRPELYIITDSVLPSVKVLHDYSVTIIASSVSGSVITWSLVSGDIPEGLTFSTSTGTLSGTPTTEGTYTFTIGATAGTLTARKEFTLEVRPPLYITTPSPLPTVKAGSYYEVVLSTDIDSDMIVTWSVISGDLPGGLTLRSNTGVISGIPDTEGTYVFVIHAVAGLLETSKTFILTVKPALSIITDSELPDARLNESYSFTLETDAESFDVVEWHLVSGDLPNGFTFRAETGTIAGTSSREGTYKFTVKAELQTTARRLSAQKIFSLSVRPQMIITNDNTYTLSAGSYSEIFFDAVVINSRSSEENITWSVISGDLPPGLTFTDNGTLKGTPTKAGTFTVTLQASQGYALSKADFTFNINLEISSPSYLPDASTGIYYSELLRVSGADSAEWSVITGTLPAGLTLNSSTGYISGNPATEGVYNFTVNASDTEGNSAQKLLRITVYSDSTLPITTTSLPSGKSGVSYYAELHSTVSGVTWSIEDGRLPGGLTLNSSNGLISGTPYESGTFTFTVKALYVNRESKRQFTLWIAPADESPDKPSGTSSSGGGGGCNSGLNLITLFVSVEFILRRRF